MTKTVEQMRAMISAEYGGWKWKNKVARMRPNQVIAIYKKFESEGRFQHLKLKKKEEPEELYYQMTIWDYMKGEQNECSSQSCDRLPY